MRRRRRPLARLAVRGRDIDLPGRGRVHIREATGPPRSPTLVLLHGLGATAALNWDACIPTLARRFRVLAPDLRGHGQGIRCGADFRLDQCADDVAALIRQECHPPVVVAGYSMGGPITQLLCRRHPELVAGMILCATARDFRGRPTERASFGLLALTALAARLAPPLSLPIPEGLRRHDLVGEIAGHEHWGILAAAASLGTFTSRDWIADLTSPAVVVVTTGDRLVPPGRQRKLAAALGAPIVELAGGHFVAHRNPQALADAILVAGNRIRPDRRRFRRVA